MFTVLRFRDGQSQSDQGSCRPTRLCKPASHWMKWASTVLSVLDEPARGERNVLISAVPDNNVVENLQVEEPGAFGELTCQSDVVLARRRVSTRMVVDED